MKRASILFIVLITLLMPGQSVSTQADDNQWCVSVWYPSSAEPTGYDSLMDNIDVIDEVNPFWYAPGLDGTLLLLDGAEDTEKLTAWRTAGVKIVPTIASFGTSIMIEDETVRAVHIATIAARVEAMDYDGIDIDYEGFALDTRDAFSAFIEGLAAALHANQHILSVTVHAKTAAVSQWDAATAQDWPRLAAAADIFRIMTYDYHNRASDAGPIAPALWVLDVLAYAATTTDLQKVRMGLHFYGLSWGRGSNVAVVSWTAVQQWIQSFELEIQRDPDDMEAMFELSARGLPRQTIYIADAVSLEFKLEQVLAAYPELGGVSIWGLGGEDPENWNILRSIGRNCMFDEPETES